MPRFTRLEPTLHMSLRGGPCSLKVDEQEHSSDPSPTLWPVAFRPSFVRSLLLHLDSYCGGAPDGMFPLF